MKKVIVTVIIAALLLVLFLPVKAGEYDDGGTLDYRALTYRLVVWNRFTTKTDEDGSQSSYKYHNISVFWFPDNFKKIDELWEIEMGRS